MDNGLRMTIAAPAAPPQSGASGLRVRNSYDAGANTRRTVGWRAPTVSSNAGILSNLATLRDRSRAATRNDGYAKGVVDKLVTNIIGTGIQPMSQCPDPALRKRIDDLWLRWTDESDADGLLDFYGQQSQAVRTWLEGGESFTRMRPRLPEDGLSVPFQVQVLEPELCPHTHTVGYGPSRIRAGIEFNAIGRRVAYYFHPSRPEVDDYDASVLRRVDGDSVAHLYDPLRPGQIRGIPHLTQALIALYELAKYRDATLLRVQLANMFVGFIKTEASLGDTQALHPLTGLPTETSTPDGKAMMSLEPGMFQELMPGEDVEFSDPPDATGFADFMRENLFATSAATGVPYEVLTGDMRSVNDRTVRLVLIEFRRRIQMMQHHNVVFQWCRPIYKAWMDRVFLSGALPIPASYATDPSPWLAVKWNAQGWPYMHPVQDVAAEKEAVRNGFKSRSAVISERGDDPEAIDAEQQTDNARADELGLRYDSDGRVQKAAPTAAAPPPAPAEDVQPDEAEEPAA